MVFWRFSVVLSLMPLVLSCSLILKPLEEGADAGLGDADHDAETESGGLCGDGVVETDRGEECDDGQLNSDTRPDACRSDCTFHQCGDGVADSAEECDDNNDVDNDDCSNTCVAVLPDLCLPCTGHRGCGREQDRCSPLVDGDYCTIDCSGGETCPAEYSCRQITLGDGTEVEQCAPERGYCSGCVDRDDDGYGIGSECVGTDCDDSDPSINPAAVETCNGVDDNCEGTESDAIDVVTLYADSDGDGHGNPTMETLECPSAGLVSNATDCDDDNAARFPGNEELCDDDIDNDCDDQIDEDCLCEGDECGDNCDDPYEMTQPSDGDLITYTGSTFGAADHFNSGCGGAGSPDRVFVITITESDTYSFETDNVGSNDFDTVVSIRATCDDSSSEIDCNDDDGGGSNTSWISLWLDPGTYYIILDGWDGANGDYQIEVHRES